MGGMLASLISDEVHVTACSFRRVFGGMIPHVNRGLLPVAGQGIAIIIPTTK